MCLASSTQFTGTSLELKETIQEEKGKLQVKGWVEKTPKWLLENFEAARIELPTSNFHSLLWF